MILNGHYALRFKMFFEAHYENYYQQQKCDQMTLVYGNIRFMRILGERGVVDNGNIQCFRWLYLRNLNLLS